MAYTINGIGGALGVSSQPVLLILQIAELTLLVFNRIGCAGERIRRHLGTQRRDENGLPTRRLWWVTNSKSARNISIEHLSGQVWARLHLHWLQHNLLKCLGGHFTSLSHWELQYRMPLSSSSSLN